MSDTERDQAGQNAGEAASPEAEYYARISEYLDGKGEEKPGYARKLVCRLDNKLPYVDITVRAYAQGYSSIFVFPVNSGKDQNETQLIRMLSRINDNMRFGQFNYDLDTGSIYFKYSSMTLPDKDLFNYGLQLGIRMVDDHANAILSVMFGLKSADEAYEELRKS